MGERNLDSDVRARDGVQPLGRSSFGASWVATRDGQQVSSPASHISGVSPIAVFSVPESARPAAISAPRLIMRFSFGAVSSRRLGAPFFMAGFCSPRAGTGY